MNIAIIPEGKTPPDARVALTPNQCAQLLQRYPGITITVAPAPTRCYTDKEYRQAGIPMYADLAQADLLLGIKEVPIDQLIPGKTYCFFSHTIKEQAYNRKLLQTVLEKKITLIDYEVLTNEKGQRLIAFGKFAGMVGAHNALLTYGMRTKAFSLPRMKDCYDYAAAKAQYATINWPAVRIVLTGTGRVATGAALVLEDMGIRKVPPAEYLENSYTEAVFTQLDCADYAARKDGSPFDLQDFFSHPDAYSSIFAPYAQASDILINGIYWDNRAPAFFTKEEMKTPDFSIQVIADVTCDIAPAASIPSTLRATTIAEPFFGYDPTTEEEVQPFQAHTVDMMTIDNLPNELPRDASDSFGQQFIQHILPELKKDHSEVLERATIAKDGKLGRDFEYLGNFVRAESRE